MKAKTIHAVVFAGAAAVAAVPSLANEGEHKPTSQQSRFATCAHESRGLKAEEHHHFMSDCLKGIADVAARKEASATSEEGGQQNRMKSCNEAAGRKDLHGDERRAFMSTCLKG